MDNIWQNVPRKRCKTCNLMTAKWQRINGGPVHCFDGCYSTTGYDHRTVDGSPRWLQGKEKKKSNAQ